MNLLAGTDNMEFGWLICTWIPYLRYVARKFEKVTIVTSNLNLKYLYADFAHEFVHQRPKITGRGDMWFASRFPNVLPKIGGKIRKQYPHCDIKEPCERYCMSDKKKFIQYGKKQENDISYDIVIHARKENKYDQDKLNYSPEKYEILLRKLRVERELSAISIGTQEGSYWIKGTECGRGMPVRNLCYLLANAKVCVGTSSGPMHLASLCGTPQVVLTNDKYLKAIKGTNRDRYERLWNPFNTPCTVLDEHKWHPPVKLVEEAVRDYL